MSLRIPASEWVLHSHHFTLIHPTISVYMFYTMDYIVHSALSMLMLIKICVKQRKCHGCCLPFEFYLLWLCWSDWMVTLTASHGGYRFMTHYEFKPINVIWYQDYGAYLYTLPYAITMLVCYFITFIPKSSRCFVLV